jgi:exopolysaccharide production protein ExoQ
MPSELAFVLTLAFIAFLFWRESLQRTEVSRALWIPLVWFLIAGSRFVSQWLNLTPPLDSATIEEGSPIDAGVFFSLIVAGLYVLKQRHVTLAKCVQNNRWLTIFLLFCFVAIFWSDFPYVAFKRWIKVLGNAIMVLIVLTDPDPPEAIRRLLKRSAYVLVPLSILFNNYYSSNVGVTTNKNSLGMVCMILGLFFFWNTLQALRRGNPRARPGELFWSVVFLGMVCWLLWTAKSATSLASMLVGMLTVALLGLRLVNKRLIGMYVLIGILALVAGEMVFGIYGNVLQLVGRDLTLTDRTELWPVLLKLQPNPILGAGFESFWLGGRLQQLWARYIWYPNQAHNGYLEIYLNLGIVGIVLLAGLIIGTFRKIRLELLSRFELGRFRLGFFFAILVYNFTEAAFVSIHSVYTMFFLIAVDYSTVRRSRPKRCSEVRRSESKKTVVSAGA